MSSIQVVGQLALIVFLAVACNESLRRVQLPSTPTETQSTDTVSITDVTFRSEGVTLAGAIHAPARPLAGVVIVHGSDRVPRMTEFANVLAERGMAVLTYDKRGVGESGGIYAGPEVGTNNISRENLRLLAKDASTAVNRLREHDSSLPIGLIGFSQAGWIIPLAADLNAFVEYMILFSGPTITTLEQLRFQFYTDGNEDFWDNHTDADARFHTKNDPDRYQFAATDPKTFLERLSIPGLWIYGELDIQLPVKMDIANLNALRAGGKPFEYCLFPELGHNTAFADTDEPVNVAVNWIKSEVR